MKTTTWRAGGASVMGASHHRRGTPNQDAALWVPRQRGDDRFIIAVADGHGGADYFRSDVGAQLALLAMESALEWFLDEPASEEELAEDVVAIWRRLVAEHIGRHPFETEPATSALSVYGSTLVCVAATQSHLLAFQLGDGDLMLGFADGRIETPLGTDADLVGEETYSLCLTDAAKFVRSRLIQREDDTNWPDFALIATDGVSKSFVDFAAFKGVVTNYRELVQSEEHLQSTLEGLPDWLNSVSEGGSGDDASLCIATSLAQA